MWFFLTLVLVSFSSYSITVSGGAELPSRHVVVAVDPRTTFPPESPGWSLDGLVLRVKLCTGTLNDRIKFRFFVTRLDWGFVSWSLQFLGRVQDRLSGPFLMSVSFVVRQGFLVRLPRVERTDRLGVFLHGQEVRWRERSRVPDSRMECRYFWDLLSYLRSGVSPGFSRRPRTPSDTGREEAHYRFLSILSLDRTCGRYGLVDRSIRKRHCLLQITTSRGWLSSLSLSVPKVSGPEVSKSFRPVSWNLTST